MDIKDLVKLLSLISAENKNESVEKEDHGFRIIVLTNGFIYVGNCTSDNNWLYITNARNIRRWGTKEGLGELSIKGPLENTKLDKIDDLKCPISTVNQLIKSDKSLW